MTLPPSPLVSVCVPAYRAARFIPMALRSIVAQTYPHIEIVVVDDASSDETEDAARSVQDPRIRIFRNERNLGGYQTMNKAIALANGALIAIYHADDVYEPTIVEREATFLLAHPEAGAVFCLDWFMDDEGRTFGASALPAELRGKPLLTYEDVFPCLLRRKNVFLRCPTFMTRRSVLAEVGPFDADRYDIAADVDMWIRILRRYPIGILEAHQMRYRVGRSQWSSRHNYLRTGPELFFTIMDRYIDEDGWRDKADPRDLVEYESHRREDETFRAVNSLLTGRPERAQELLARPYPWRSLLRYPTRRKLKVLGTRAILRSVLRRHTLPQIRTLLHRMAYRRRIVPDQVTT